MATTPTLKDRAARIVAAISGCDREAAGRWLEEAGGSVKIAVLLAARAGNQKAAQELLQRNGQKLRAALAELARDPKKIAVPSERDHA